MRKWASWTIKKVTHRLFLEAKVTSCGLPAQWYIPTWKPRGVKQPQERIIKDKSRRQPTCVMCIDAEAEFGGP